MTGQSVNPKRSNFRLNKRTDIVNKLGGYVRAVGRNPLVGHFLFHVGNFAYVCKLGYAHIRVFRNAFEARNHSRLPLERRFYSRARGVERLGNVYTRSDMRNEFFYYFGKYNTYFNYTIASRKNQYVSLI